MAKPSCFSVQKSFISWCYLSSVCACWLKHFLLEITKMTWKADNYNRAKIHVKQNSLGKLVFYQGFLNFAFYIIVLYGGKHVYSYGPTGAFPLPQGPKYCLLHAESINY